MNSDLFVLRALARICRSRSVASGGGEPTFDALVRRFGGDPALLMETLVRLERAGLVHRRSPSDVRLTMVGLAVATASAAAAPDVKPAKPAKRSATRRAA